MRTDRPRQASEQAREACEISVRPAYLHSSTWGVQLAERLREWGGAPVAACCGTEGCALGKHEASVQDDIAVVVTNHHAVHPDFAQATDRQDAQRRSVVATRTRKRLATRVLEHGAQVRGAVAHGADSLQRAASRACVETCEEAGLQAVWSSINVRKKTRKKKKKTGVEADSKRQPSMSGRCI